MARQCGSPAGPPASCHSAMTKELSKPPITLPASGETSMVKTSCNDVKSVIFGSKNAICTLQAKRRFLAILVHPPTNNEHRIANDKIQHGESSHPPARR